MDGILLSIDNPPNPQKKGVQAKHLKQPDYPKQTGPKSELNLPLDSGGISGRTFQHQPSKSYKTIESSGLDFFFWRGGDGVGLD